MAAVVQIFLRKNSVKAAAIIANTVVFVNSQRALLPYVTGLFCNVLSICSSTTMTAVHAQHYCSFLPSTHISRMC